MRDRLEQRIDLGLVAHLERQQSGASTSRASGSTKGSAFSFRYVIAISAPARRIAWAHPQAIERSLATPTMSAFIPLNTGGSAPGHGCGMASDLI